VDYFVADVETSGPAPGIHSLLSIGFTHVRRAEGRYQLFEDFYLELRPQFSAVFEPAMAIHGLDMERLKRDGVPPKDAMARIAGWVKKQQRQPKERPVFVAHNAPFDWMFVAWHFAWSEIDNPFGHSAIDTKALGMGVLNVPWNQTSLKQLQPLLPGVPPRDTKDLHHAGADARYQALVFASLMNLRETGVSRRGA
jgi:DNA polymerase III alpha subunit (gram-positive type)